MRKSYIADNIMRDYEKKKRIDANRLRKEIDQYKRIKCINCKNKDTDLCELRRNIKGQLQCVNKEV